MSVYVILEKKCTTPKICKFVRVVAFVYDSKQSTFRLLEPIPANSSTSSRTFHSLFRFCKIGLRSLVSEILFYFWQKNCRLLCLFGCTTLSDFDLIFKI